MGAVATFFSFITVFGYVMALDDSSIVPGTIVLILTGPSALISLFLVDKYRPRIFYIVLIMFSTLALTLASMISMHIKWW